jgi:hypothetical protein
VLLRDISHAVRVQGEPTIVASLVFDMGTGVVLASRIAADEELVLAEVCEMALVEPARGLAPCRPTRVLCSHVLASRLAAVLGELITDADLPDLEEVATVHEAEDIFDSFVGHMAGRRDPKEFPDPADWHLLFEHVLSFYERQPWTRWADDVDLLIETRTGTQRATFVAIVLGNADVEYGLLLYRGKAAPAGLRGAKRARPMPTPRGTLMLNFSPPDEMPPEFVGKALRYGWPKDADLIPIVLSVEHDRPGEPSRDEVRALTVVLASLVEHDGQGPVLLGTRPRASSGTIALADETETSFTVRRLSRADDAEEHAQLRLHLAGSELVPRGTPIVMGSTSTTALASLRRDAVVYRPLPPECPNIELSEVPLIVVVTDHRDGDAIAARVAEMDPFGVSVAVAEGLSAVVLVGACGAEMLMELPSGDPALKKFRSRMKASKGVHAILVADEGSARDEGKVYGLFELHLPDQRPQGVKRAPGGRSPSSRPKKRR